MKKKFVTVLTAVTAMVMCAVMLGACADKEKKYTFLSVTPDESVTVTVGKTTQLYGVVETNEITDKSVTFKSADETIAAVDASGVVTAKKVGETTVTVTVKAKSDVSKSVKIVVEPVDERDVDLKIVLKLGDGITLPAGKTPHIAGTVNGWTHVPLTPVEGKTNEWYMDYNKAVPGGQDPGSAEYKFTLGGWDDADLLDVGQGKANIKVNLERGEHTLTYTVSKIGA